MVVENKEKLLYNERRNNMQNKPNTYNDLIRGKNQLNYATRSGMAQTNAYLRNITTPSSQTTSSQVLPNQYKSESALNTPTENKKSTAPLYNSNKQAQANGALVFSRDPFIEGFTYYDDDFGSSKEKSYVPKSSGGRNSLNSSLSPSFEDDFLQGFNSTSYEENVSKQSLPLSSNLKSTEISTKSQPKKSAQNDTTTLEEDWEYAQNIGKPKTDDEWANEICKGVPTSFPDDASLWAEISDIQAAKKGDKTSKWYQRLEQAWALGKLDVYEMVEQRMNDLEKDLRSRLDGKIYSKSSLQSLAEIGAQLHDHFSYDSGLDDQASKNRIYNESLDLSSYKSTGGYINNQGNKNAPINKVRYGNDIMEKNGCGIIAIHNALIALGETPDVRDLAMNFEGYGQIFDASWGTNYYAIEKYFRAKNYKVTMIDDASSLSDYRSNIPDANVYILTYWNSDSSFDGLHTVAIRKHIGNTFVMHNVKGGVLFGKDVKELIMKIGNNATSLICISK